MSSRVTYRRKHTYKTRSNQIRKFHTPGGKLSVQVRNKRVSPVVCGETKVALNGLPVLNKRKWVKLTRKQRSVSRPYGGVYTHEIVRNRYLYSILQLLEF
jgi:large subunit ribosomal protein L34e